MRQMTVRDIPDDIEAIVRSEAAVRGVSLNKAFLTVLKRGAQQVPAPFVHQKPTKDRFTRFCGIWGNDDAAVFDDATDKQRTIESELWQ
jgi:hypothetical protein